MPEPAVARAEQKPLPAPALVIPPAAGFLVLPPGHFAEAGPIVGDARAALASYDRQAPPQGKNRKRFLVNVLDAATLTLDSPALRLAHDASSDSTSSGASVCAGACASVRPSV